MAEYPEYIKRIVRQAIGLEDEYDTSRDEEISRMNPDEVFERVLNWDGDIGAFYKMKSRVEDIYGIVLPETREGYLGRN